MKKKTKKNTGTILVLRSSVRLHATHAIGELKKTVLLQNQIGT